MRYRYIFIGCLLLFALSGCSSFQQQRQMSAFNELYSQGEYHRALDSVTFQENKDSGQENKTKSDEQDNNGADAKEHLMELLQQADLYRFTGQYQKSIDAFDRAESGMKSLDLQNMAQKAAEGFMAVMVNDAEMDYKPLMAEAVLVNTYKALDFLASANADLARVEFNRADDRTRRAVDYFSDEIIEEQDALNDKMADNYNGQASAVRHSLQSNNLKTAVASHYGAPSDWTVFSDFIVPASTYLHGLFFLANAADQSDYERAKTSLKRVANIIPNSAAMQRDARLAEAMASGKRVASELPQQVWVVYENGLGPVRREIRFEVPLLLFRHHQRIPAYFGIALPRYAERQAVPGHITATSSSGTSGQTQIMTRMEKVIRTEMKARFPAILTRAVTSAVVKAAIQDEAARRLGVIGQILAAVLSSATTHADLRSWQTIPDRWEATRVDRPADGELTLSIDAGATTGKVQIPDQPFTLVYVKQTTAQSPAVVSIIDLQGRNTAVTRRLGSLDSQPHKSLDPQRGQN